MNISAIIKLTVSMALFGSIGFLPFTLVFPLQSLSLLDAFAQSSF